MVCIHLPLNIHADDENENWNANENCTKLSLLARCVLYSICILPMPMPSNGGLLIHDADDLVEISEDHLSVVSLGPVIASPTLAKDKVVRPVDLTHRTLS